MTFEPRLREAATDRARGFLQRLAGALTARRIGFARIAVLLLIGAMMAAGAAAWLSHIASQSIDHALEVQGTADRLWNAITAAETGQRGYLITGEETYLAPYNFAMQETPRLLARLQELVSGEADQSARVMRISGEIQKRFQELSNTITAYRSGDRERSVAIVRSGLGQALMEDLSGDFGDLAEAESTILRAREGRFDLYEALLFASIAVAILFSLVVLVLQRQATLDNIRALERGAAQLRLANDNLEGLVAARTEELSKAKKQAEDLAKELADHLRRFDLALRGAAVTAFSQDQNLRYTWVSRDANPEPKSAGPPDEWHLEFESGKLLALQTSVIETGQPSSGEIHLSGPGGERWYEVRLEPTRNESGAVTGLTGVAVDITERREREGRIQLLLREITHRSKNLLTIIQSMARQTAQRTATPSEFVEVFSRRIQSLAASHDLLLQDDWAGAAITRILQAQLAPFAELIGTRITFAGPDVRLRPEAAQGLGMAIHELVTNAAKFGALSVPGGKIEACWSVAGEAEAKRLLFEWKERGVPKSAPPIRHGFGHVVLEGVTARSLSGTSQFNYGPEGVTWSIDIPGTWILG